MAWYRCAQHGSYNVPDGTPLVRVHCPSCNPDGSPYVVSGEVNEAYRRLHDVMVKCPRCGHVTLHRYTGWKYVCSECGGRRLLRRPTRSSIITDKLGPLSLRLRLFLSILRDTHVSVRCKCTVCDLRVRQGRRIIFQLTLWDIFPSTPLLKIWLRPRHDVTTLGRAWLVKRAWNTP